MNLKKVLFIALTCCVYQISYGQKIFKISRDRLQDKIKGGWAGQTIGVTFGGPYEFRFNGTFIQDYQPLHWKKGYIKETMTDMPGLYDDLYMDLTFVDVIEKYGLNAPTDSFANAFAHAGFMLWHANQAARYNILNGIGAPASGNWRNNPHSDDIDYQIESDFAGLMSPGMPNTASAISDKVGHIMNYGDGWYGGIFIGALYSLAFTSDDIPAMVTQALSAIPKKSTFFLCLNDVIEWHRRFPDDWHRTWYEIQNKWSSDRACPDGIFMPFNIDAKINAAYVALALLYGKGDFSKSLEIATRAGQDADCNPSSVGGVLGTVLGYNNIPARWKNELSDAEDIDFKYTTISLNKVYTIGLEHALKNIEKQGGKVNGNDVSIFLQKPEPVQLEQGFPDLYPVEKRSLDTVFNEISFDVQGTGFTLSGFTEKRNEKAADYVFDAEMTIDGKTVERAKLSTSFTTRRLELFWKYGLSDTKHTVTIKVLNQSPDYEIKATDLIVFSNQPSARPRND